MKKSVVASVVSELQKEVARFYPNSTFRIKQYVTDYLEKSLMSGEPVNLLIQWCITKMLDLRSERQGGALSILPGERKFFEQDIPRLVSLFEKWGFRINLILTFNVSEFERSRPLPETQQKYQDLILKEIEKNKLDMIVMSDKEFFGDFVLQPNQEVLDNFENVVKKGAFEFEFERGKKLMEDYGYDLSEKKIAESTRKKIAGSAEEGRILAEDIFPEGFLLLPIEDQSRYDFFDLVIKDFKQRLVPAVRPYPWRLEELY